MSKKTIVSRRSPTPGDAELGKLIRARRIEASMSQDDLGKHLGVSFQQVQKYEKGTNRVSVTRLHEIAKAFGEDVSYFTGPANKQTSTLVNMLTDSASQRLLRGFHAIKDQNMRYQIVALVEKIGAGKKAAA